MTAKFPIVDFKKAPLSKSAKHQFAEIIRTISRPDGGGRTGLRNLILRNAFNVDRGVYVPIGDDVYLPGKLPDISRTVVNMGPSQELVPFAAPFFTNGLVIPAGYGTATFCAEQAPAPLERATNIGFLVVTIEFDCQCPEQFEENLAWTRSPKGDGDFSRSPFAELDREFRRVKEYRGFSIVFSGNKSLHFHFVFSTEHLLNVPYGAVAGDRQQGFREASALLHNAHARYWDHVHEAFVRILSSSIPADRKLRSLTQWRRAPWGIRLLDEKCLLGFPRGTQVPQLVIRERILQRAPKGNDGFLVPETFSLAHPIRTSRRSSPNLNLVEFDRSSMLELLGEACFAEWGQWPKPAAVNIQNGEWLFRFRNHANDRHPSTIVLGNYRQLQLNGIHQFGDGQFYLPDQMTAQELGNHLAERLGWQPLDQDPVGLDAGFGIGGARPDRVIVRNAAIADPDIAKRDYRGVLRQEIAQRSDLGMVSLI